MERDRERDEVRDRRDRELESLRDERDRVFAQRMEEARADDRRLMMMFMMGQKKSHDDFSQTNET